MQSILKYYLNEIVGSEEDNYCPYDVRELREYLEPYDLEVHSIDAFSEVMRKIQNGGKYTLVKIDDDVYAFCELKEA